MLSLIAVELLKLKRSLLSLAIVACPLVEVAMIFLVTARRSGLSALSAEQTLSLWQNMTAVWCYFMLPLFVGLVTALINGQEHRNGAWSVMLTQPVTAGRLYLAKAIVAWLTVVASSSLLVGFYATAAWAGGAGVDLQDPVARAEVLWFLPKLMLSCIPALLIQLLVSWFARNIVVPISIAMLATLIAIQVASSEYWPFFPWSYMLVSANAADPAMQQRALFIAAIAGASVLFGSMRLLDTRRARHWIGSSG